MTYLKVIISCYVVGCVLFIATLSDPFVFTSVKLFLRYSDVTVPSFALEKTLISQICMPPHPTNEKVQTLFHVTSLHFPQINWVDWNLCFVYISAICPQRFSSLFFGAALTEKQDCCWFKCCLLLLIIIIIPHSVFNLLVFVLVLRLSFYFLQQWPNLPTGSSMFNSPLLQMFLEIIVK